MENEIKNEIFILKQLNNIVTKENMKKMIISKEDYINYVNQKKTIELKEYEKYLKTKSGKSREIKNTVRTYSLYPYSNNVLVGQEGFEPPTPRLEGVCSIQLSY